MSIIRKCDTLSAVLVYRQVAAFLVGVMRGKFGEDEPQVQAQAQQGSAESSNDASPEDEHGRRVSSRASTASRRCGGY